MASATAAETKTRAVTKPAAAAPVEVSTPSRREFLYYIWGASIALLLGEATAGIIWFAIPRFKEGTFGGIFSLAPSKVPPVNAAPYHEAAGRFWVSNTDHGLVVLYGVCPHLGCLPNWIQTNNRFECPCHGSKYQLDGHYIEGPAPRSMDRFATVLTFNDGSQVVMDDTGDPMLLGGKTKEDIAKIEINTGKRIKRNGRV